MGIKKITHEGEIILGESSIPCFVLEDGTRVLSGRGMQQALRVVENKKEGDKLSQFFKNKPTIQRPVKSIKLENEETETPLIQTFDVASIKPFPCYRGTQKISGYEASVLIDICEYMLELRNSENYELTPRQAIVATQCEILVRGFARIGLVALIDEATGYQYDRERFELQKILKAYISEETLKWQLTFTDEFYKEMFRLWNIPFTPTKIKSAKPRVIGLLTKKFIYEPLPNGVLEVLEKKNPKDEKGNRKAKLHQSLTPDIGREHLKKQIHEVTMLMKISKTKSQFENFFKEEYGDGQITLDSFSEYN